MAKFLGAHLASPFLLCSCAKFCCDDHLCCVIFPSNRIAKLPSNRIAKLGKYDLLINSIRELFLKCFLHCKAAKKQRSKTLQYIREFGNWHIKKMSKSYECSIWQNCGSLVGIWVFASSCYMNMGMSPCPQVATSLWSLARPSLSWKYE